VPVGFRRRVDAASRRATGADNEESQDNRDRLFMRRMLSERA
jgi:hypothetical protein